MIRMGLNWFGGSDTLLGPYKTKTCNWIEYRLLANFCANKVALPLDPWWTCTLRHAPPVSRFQGSWKSGASRCLFWLPKGTGPAILTEGGKSWYDCLHIQSRYPILLLSECVLVADVARKGPQGSSGKCGFLWCFGASRRYLAVVFLQSAYIGHQQIHERNKESRCQVTFLCSWEEENKLNISIPLCTLYLHIVRWMPVL